MNLYISVLVVPSNFDLEVFDKTWETSVIDFQQSNRVQNVTGRVLQVEVERMILRVPCVRGPILRSRSKTGTRTFTHCWPEV